MDSRDGLPRGALPSGILKMKKYMYCPGLDQDQICKKRTNSDQDQLKFSNHGPAHNFVSNVLFCFQSIFFMFPIHACIESFAIYILTKSSLFKFKLLQKWFSDIVARLDRFHEKLLRHTIFKWGPVTDKFSDWEFWQIWANLERKNPTSNLEVLKVI